MTTVRVKLVALVLACVAPAVVGAIALEHDVEVDMIEQVGRRVDGVNRRFGLELEEYQESSTLALSFADQTARFGQALAAGDADGAARLVKRLSEVYKDRLILASDRKGAILARGNAERAPASLDASASPSFGELLSGKPLQGLIAVQFSDGPGYALVSARPVQLENEQVGALALLTPLGDSYLDYLESKLNASLTLEVNGKVVATSAQDEGHDHPGAGVRSDEAGVVFKEVGPRLFALKTFQPEKLQRPGLVVELTASRDVTELRDTVRRDLYRMLGGLGLVLIIVLALALRFAARLGGAVRAISDAATQVKAGNYVAAPVIETGDELESLALDFNAMVQGLKERDHLKETFGRYVTRQVADHLMQGSNQTLGGELVPVTVLFSDIRSFTSISESMEPRALLDFLNEYFSGMVESVMQNHGVVDKFIGDAIMAVFGAPVPEPGDPLHAIKAALEMRARLEKINIDFQARGLPEIRTGIGLHSGQVVAGNMGHAERMEYTVIGDAVNLASRLEGMTKELGCDVILSEDLFVQVREYIDVEPLRKIKVKGRDQEVMVYRLVGLKVAA